VTTNAAIAARGEYVRILVLFIFKVEHRGAGKITAIFHNSGDAQSIAQFVTRPRRAVQY
jgi:hypothetical protein